MFFYLTLAGFVVSLMLGGPTQHGSLPDALLQILTVPLLLVAGWRLILSPSSPEVRWSVAFCAAMVALPLIQLLPLPPFVWSHIPGRDSLVATYSLLGYPLDWRPISMDSEGTWLSALALLPSIGIFLAVSTLEWSERRKLSIMLVTFAVVSGFMALLQAAQGAESPLRFYNRNMQDNAPVGFFANRNHLSALLYCGGVLAMAWILASLDSLREELKSTRNRSLVMIAGSAFAFLSLISVEMVVRSRAGVLLFFVGWLGLFALSLVRPSSRQFEPDGYGSPRPFTKNRLPIGAVVFALAAIAFLVLGWSSLQGVLERLSADPLANERPVFAKVTFSAALALLPFGAGLGSFVPVYQMFEKPKDLFGGVYANHAHNDLLELGLETGLGGLFLLTVFLIWLVSRMRKALLARDRRRGIDLYLLDAALIVIILLLGHSLVDYPLRTGAMTSVFSFACALLIEPPSATHHPEIRRSGHAGLQRRRSESHPPTLQEA